MAMAPLVRDATQRNTTREEEKNGRREMPTKDARG